MPSHNPPPLTIDLSNGLWTCRWVGDLLYQKDISGGISVVPKVIYSSQTGKLVTVYPPIESLFTTIPGTQITVTKKCISGSILSNARQGRTVYHLPITGHALRASSRRLYRYLTETHPADPGELLPLARRLGLPDHFSHSHAHRIPNTNPRYAVDYFLIPSAEVLRYFFLQGSELSHHLLTYFTGLRENAAQEIDGLVAHPTGTARIVPHAGRKVALLTVKEGLSAAEINCLARIAFVPRAHECLRKVRHSLLFNTLTDNKYAYGKLETIFPQEMPFNMAVCGTRFTWKNHTYLLVDQIYDTQEVLPYDQVLYAPLVDHRSQPHVADPEQHVRTTSHLPKTIPAPSYRLTGDQLGNRNQPADLLAVLETGFSYEEQLLPPVKLEKEGQVARYHTLAILPVMQEFISLLKQAQQQAGAGRGHLHRRDTAHYAPTAAEPQTLFQALSRVEGYRRSYFSLDGATPCFLDSQHINTHRSGYPFDVLLCRLVPTRSRVSFANVYFVWANTRRYAIFYAPALRPLSEALLMRLCTQQFGVHGLPVSLNEGQVKRYQRRNPSAKDAHELTMDIQDELADILDDHTPKLR